MITADAEVTAISPGEIALSATGTIDGQAGGGSVSVTGTLRNEDMTLSVDLQLQSRGHAAGFAGDGDVALSFTLDPSGELKGTATIDGLQAERSGPTPTTLGNATGSVEFTASANGLERLAGDLALFDVAVAGWIFPQIPVRLSLKDSLVSLAAQLDAPEIDLAITVGGVLQDLRNHISFDAKGSLFPRNLPLPADVGAHGRVQFNVAGQLREPMLLASLPPAAWPKSLTIDGQAFLDLRDIRYAKAFEADTLRGPLVWSLRNETLLIDAAEGLSADIRVPEQLIARFGDLVPDTVAVRLGGPGATPPSLSMTPGDDGWNIAFATGASIPSFHVSAETDLRLDLDQAFQLRNLTVPFLLAEIASLAPFGLDGSADIAATNVAANLETATAEISGSATLATWQNDTIRADGLRAELDVTVVWKDKNLTVQLGPSTRISLDSLARDTFAVGPTTIGLSPAAPASLTIGADGTLAYDLSPHPLYSKDIRAHGTGRNQYPPVASDRNPNRTQP